MAMGCGRVAEAKVWARARVVTRVEGGGGTDVCDDKGVEAAREVASSATMVAARVMLGCGEDDTV